jgi:N-acetylglucosaminyldiphosphoundecaprenol N-acetyl-beta-D-mannosaminyltransferase
VEHPRIRPDVEPQSPAARAPRLVIGHVPVDALTLDGAVEAVAHLVEARRGGAVFTPNVDHVVKAERDPELRAAYAAADLSLADGMPLVWASRLLGRPLPERVAGADLVLPLAARAAERGWSLYLLGGAPGDAERAAAELVRRCGVRVAGVDAGRVELGEDGAAERRALVERIRAASPDLVYVALGAPKQEVWIHRHRGELGPAVLLGVGGSLAFVAGTVPRAPRWMARAGLEWLHRLGQEPRRLWRRYLVEDVAFVPILLRTLRRRGAGRP